jgi:ATP-dependent DNA helicase RecQ
MQLFTGLTRTWDGHPQQRFMENSTRQAGNVVDTFAVDEPIPSGPVLLVDDISQSGWTFTAVAELLRSAGSGPVLPVALSRRP